MLCNKKLPTKSTYIELLAPFSSIFFFPDIFFLLFFSDFIYLFLFSFLFSFFLFLFLFKANQYCTIDVFSDIFRFFFFFFFFF